MRNSGFKLAARFIGAAALVVLLAQTLPAKQMQQKDYLSGIEADKIRDAETVNEKVTLYLTFAEDRLKKFQYELEHPALALHAETLNGLMNGYESCVDDAADLLQEGIEGTTDAMNEAEKDKKKVAAPPVRRKN